MGLHFKNLDQNTHNIMKSEVDLDVEKEKLYFSSYLNDVGRRLWPKLLVSAAESTTDDELANDLRKQNCLKTHTERRKPKGGFTLVAVPVTAAQTLAEAQFNMYYMRALACRAIDEKKSLIVYRGKEVKNPRSESEDMIGKSLDPHLVLRVLRETQGVDPSIGIPLPNSGITVELV